MQLISRALCLLSLLSTLPACVFDESCQTILVMEQRSSEVIPELDLNDEVSISIGDVERALEADELPKVEDVVIFSRDQILAEADELELRKTLLFSYEGRTFEVYLNGVESHTFSPDKATLIISVQ